MRFFQDRHGRYYPVNEISCIRKYSGKREPGKFYYDTIELKDGREVLVSPYTASELIDGAGEVLAAQPGFTLLKMWYSPGENEPYVSESPILGWMMTSEEGVKPITIDSDDYDDRCGILCPDGQVRTYDAHYDDRAAWEADMKRMAETQHAAKLQAKADRAAGTVGAAQ